MLKKVENAYGVPTISARSMVAAVSTLDRLLDPLFTPDLAERVLTFTLTAEVASRLDYLRAQANEGLLSDCEREEYRQFIEALEVLAILKGLAESSLARQNP